MTTTTPAATPLGETWNYTFGALASDQAEQVGHAVVARAQHLVRLLSEPVRRVALYSTVPAEQQALGRLADAALILGPNRVQLGTTRGIPAIRLRWEVRDHQGRRQPFADLTVTGEEYRGVLYDDGEVLDVAHFSGAGDVAEAVEWACSELAVLTVPTP
ncbi:hypothetical protein [Kineococcus terrestris]|uniref:hypothetical protein n=1 Tax=Kineococcus terrestris TaxID=2044856 RepID=UPI0034DB578B